MKFLVAVFAAALAAASAAAAREPALADAAFLAGHWTGDHEGLVFEESWLGPNGNVMTGMARGVKDGALGVLEYIVVEEKNGAVFMRFKHFNADFSTWEDAGPIVLKLVEAKTNDILFRNDDPQAEVQSVRYRSPSEGVLDADVALIRDGAPSGFSLHFKKAAD